MRKPQFYFIALAFVAMTFIATLPVKAYGGRHFGVPQGLANRQVHAVTEDGNGFIWVNSISGVQRFDGRQFRTYELPGVMPSQDYWRAGTRFGRDNQGRLRVSLRTGLLFVYNPETDAFETVFDLHSHGINSMIENVLYSDSTLLCTDDGIYSVGNSGQPHRMALQGYSIYDLCETAKDVYYAASSDGVFKLSRSNGKIQAHRIPGIDSNRVTCLLHLGDKLYVGTFAAGLYAVDLATDKVRKIPLPVDWMPVYTLLKVPDGNVMLGQDGAGIFVIDPLDSKVIERYDETSPVSISANTVKDICRDSNGGLWVTTTSDGLNYISPTTKSAWFTRSTGNPSTGICSDFVNVVFEDSDGDMWYGTDKGVSRCDKYGNWWHYLKADNGTNTQVLTLEEGKDGRIWVGGYGMDVYMISKKDGHVTRLPDGPADSGLTTKYIFRLLRDGDNMWIAGIQGRVVRYNTVTGTYRRYQPECVADLATDGNGTVFIGGCDGLGIYTPQSDSVTIHMQLDSLLLTHPIRTFAYDKRRSELWVASDGDGLIRYTPSTGAVRRFDNHGQLANASINTVACDNDGRVWFFTIREVYVIDADRQKVMNMTPVLGIGDAEFLVGTAVVKHDGNICVGTTQGAFTFDPGLQFDAFNDSKLIFTDLKVNHETVRPGDDAGILAKCLDMTGQITLNPDENTFAFLFSSLNFNESQRLELRWKLEGYDKRWLSEQNTYEVTYKNVSPGKYRFRLQSYDSFTDSVIEERTIKITVLPPIWLRWWAIGIYFIIGLAAIWFIWRRTRHMQREKLVNTQIQSLLGLAHDLRAPISLIKAPLSEIETRETLTPDGLDNLRLAKANTDKLLEMISRLLDLQRYDKAGVGMPVKIDMRQYLEDKAAEFHLNALHKNDTINVDVSETMPPVMCDYDIINHIIDNLLSNAVKYTESGTITLSSKILKGCVFVGIADTGRGISRKDRRHLFRERFRSAEAIESKEPGSGMGLLIVHRLASMIKGSVKIVSEHGKGTQACLTFPLVLAEESPRAIDDNEKNDAERHERDREMILIAEDDRDLHDYLAKALSDKYDVASLDTTKDAIEQIKAQNPDIVLTDVMMPGIGGIEMCKAIKADVDTSHIPVVILSGLGERHNVVEGLQAGANDYIVKPFDMTILRVRIRNILDRQRKLQQSIISAAGDTSGDYAEPEYATELDKEFMQHVTHLIDSHLSDHLYTIADFCRDLGMSRTSAYNKIRQLTGESINDYIRIVRLNRAKEMLATQNYSVSEVAYTVGFSDPKYFSTCFKKHFGTNPSKV